MAVEKNLSRLWKLVLRDAHQSPDRDKNDNRTDASDH